MKFDLHMHSNYSRDGDYTPKQLIEFINEKQIKCVALCDHNEVCGIDEMIEHGNKYGIEVIPALEFDTLFEGRETHLLGYGINYKDEYYEHLSTYINTIMDDVTEQRIKKFEKVYNIKMDRNLIYPNIKDGDNPFFIICEYLFTYHTDIEDFKPYLPGGERSDPAYPNFFWDLCKKGKPNYVEVLYPDFKETVDRIHRDGGIAIIAHPHNNFYQQEDLLQKAIEYGIDGLEAYSNYHSAQQNEYYEGFCRNNNLIFTMGSDFHGSLKPSIELGEYGYKKDKQLEIYNAFKDKLKAK